MLSALILFVIMHEREREKNGWKVFPQADFTLLAHPCFVASHHTIERNEWYHVLQANGFFFHEKITSWKHMVAWGRLSNVRTASDFLLHPHLMRLKVHQLWDLRLLFVIHTLMFSSFFKKKEAVLLLLLFPLSFVTGHRNVFKQWRRKRIKS